MRKRRPRVLIIGNDESFQRTLEQALSGYRAVIAASMDESLRWLDGRTIDVIVASAQIVSAGADGLGLLKQRAPETEVLVVANASTVEDARRYMNGGCFDYFVKPFAYSAFLGSLHKAHQQRERALRGRPSIALVCGDYTTDIVLDAAVESRCAVQVVSVSFENDPREQALPACVVLFDDDAKTFVAAC